MRNLQQASENAAPSRPVNVLLAYDSPRTCATSLKMLGRISDKLHDTQLFNVNAFKFGLLERMDPFKWAPQADSVQLALIACGEKTAPDAGFLRWIETWARNHSGKEAVLGLLPIGPHTSRAFQGVVGALREIAARYHLSFIYENEASPDSIQATGTAVA